MQSAAYLRSSVLVVYFIALASTLAIIPYTWIEEQKPPTHV